MAEIINGRGVGCRCARVGSASGRLAHPDCSSGVVARVAETPWTGSATRDAVRRHDTVSIADARPLRRGLPSWMEAGLLITQRSWFASVPGATLPNRLYALCGVAAGSRDDRPPYVPPVPPARLRP